MAVLVPYRNNPKYKKFIKDFANYFVGDILKELRFLLSGRLNISILCKNDAQPIEFFQEMGKNGSISPTEVKICMDIAELTGIIAAKTLLSKYVGENEEWVKSGKGILPYRRSFYKAMKDTTYDCFLSARADFGLTALGSKITDLWDVVMYLENAKQLQTRTQLKSFADNLCGIAQSTISEGLDKLVPKDQENLADLVPVGQQQDTPDKHSIPKDIQDVKPQKTHDVFISYRRANGAELASLLKGKIEDEGLTVFMDVESLGAGRFEQKLLTGVKSARNFIIVLLPGVLDRCMDDHAQNDWIHKEVVTAMESDCTIIPVYTPEFKWPNPERLPKDMRNIKKNNAVKWIHEYQDASVHKIVKFLLEGSTRKRDYQSEHQVSVEEEMSTTQPTVENILPIPEGTPPTREQLRSGAGSSSNAESQITKLNVGSDGGTLTNKETKLVIYPGAIEEGLNVEVSLENTSFPSDLLSDPLETILSPVVRCGPPGTIFRNHCLLSFPHNAINEESWEFTLLVTKTHQGEWRKIKLDSKEDDITFSLHNGQCCVRLKHFTRVGLIGRLINKILGRKTARLGVFGRVLTDEYHDEYQLRVRTWDTDREEEIDKENKKYGQLDIEMPKNIDLLHNDMDMEIEVENEEGWKVKPPKQTISASEVWKTTTWRVFHLTRSDPLKHKFRAKVLTQQRQKKIELPFVWELEKSRNTGSEPPIVSANPPPTLKTDRRRDYDAPSTSSNLPRQPPQVDRTDYASELSDLEFNDLLTRVSNWCDKQGQGYLNKMKMVISEFKSKITLFDIQAMDTTHDLIRLLVTPGIIKPTDIRVLIEVIKLCGMAGVESVIKPDWNLPKFKDVPITNFSVHRRKLLQFSYVVGKVNTTTIGQLYSIREETDPNSLILKLEIRGYLTEGDKMNEFIEKLREYDMTSEINALTRLDNQVDPS